MEDLSHQKPGVSGEPAEELLKELRRSLPAVGRLMETPVLAGIQELYGREAVLVQVREVLAELRIELAEKANLALTQPIGNPEEVQAAWRERLERLPDQVSERLKGRLGQPLRRVLNATGVFLHTNLGRAPLPGSVAKSLPALQQAYCDLEFNLETGRRGSRTGRVEDLLKELTGAEAAAVVNNNAAALVLILHSLARGQEVVVSRGELVEIGGSFRVPAILEAAGARLVEVGTTNRTRISDYAEAIAGGSESSQMPPMLLKIHPSNYRIEGFVESPSTAELVELGRATGATFVVDEGSGLLRPHPSPQLREHESLQEYLAQGVDLVCGSGDKVLGGPQAGLILGRADLVKRCAKNPLYRALRTDRGTLASLEGVLRMHLVSAELPLDRLWIADEPHRERLEAFRARAAEFVDAPLELVKADGFIGGGAAPQAPIPGWALSVPGNDDLVYLLRTGSPGVVGYLREGRLILDLRTVDPMDDHVLLESFERALVRLKESS